MDTAEKIQLRANSEALGKSGIPVLPASVREMEFILMKFSKINGLHGEVTIPGDKSISHRSVMFGSLAKGTTKITGFLQGADCLSTISCFQKMGVSIDNLGDTVLVHGNGLHGLKKPEQVLDCGNSGTTTRLISGILRTGFFRNPHRRRLHPEASHEADHGTAKPDGR